MSRMDQRTYQLCQECLTGRPTIRELSGLLPKSYRQTQYMIFRMKWGSEETPFVMNEYLTVSKVTKNSICTFGIVDVRKNKNANQKGRDLIAKGVEVDDCCKVAVVRQ